MKSSPSVAEKYVNSGNLIPTNGRINSVSGSKLKQLSGRLECRVPGIFQAPWFFDSKCSSKL